MKRFLLFFLPIVLTAAFLMPATVQAKKIKYSKNIILEGDKFPGQGVLSIEGKLTLTGTFEGTGKPHQEFNILVNNCDLKATLSNGSEISFESKARWKYNNGYEIELVKGNYTSRTAHGEQKFVIDGYFHTVTLAIDESGEIKLKNFCLSLWGQEFEPIDNITWKDKETKDMLMYPTLQDSKAEKCIKHYIVKRYTDKGVEEPIDVMLTDSVKIIYDKGIEILYSCQDLHNISDLISINWPNGDFYLADYVNDFPYERLITSSSFDDEQAIQELTKKRIDPYEGKVFIKRTFGSSSISVSTLHENHPILTGTFNYIGHKEDVGIAHHISYSDGNNFRGRIRNKDTFIDRFIKANTPSEIGIEYHNGLLTDKDETIRGFYFRGMNKEQLEKAAQKETEEIKKKKAEKDKELQDYYDNLCQKYGKKYVDAALLADIIVGMPEELVFKRFGNELSPRYESNSYRSFWWNKPKAIWNKGESAYHYYIVNLYNGKVYSVIK